MLDGQPDPMPAVLLHHSQSALYAEILRRTLPGVDLIVADEAESGLDGVDAPAALVCQSEGVAAHSRRRP
jgi:hypothetical protein